MRGNLIVLRPFCLWVSLVSENVGGDKVEGTVGNDAKNTVVGSDIHQDVRETKAESNVTVNVPAWNPAISHGQDRGRLPTEIEQEFRQTFAKISDRLSENSVALVRLEATIEKNNILTQQQIDTLKHNQKSLEELAKDTDAKIVKTLAGLHLVAAPSSSLRIERPWMVPARLVFQALTAVGALGLLIYFVMGG